MSRLGRLACLWSPAFVVIGAVPTLAAAASAAWIWVTVAFVLAAGLMFQTFALGLERERAEIAEGHRDDLIQWKNQGQL